MASADILDGAEEQSTSRFRIRVKGLDDRDEVIIRIDRKSGNGRPLYETLYLSYEEVEALKTALMNETD